MDGTDARGERDGNSDTGWDETAETTETHQSERSSEKRRAKREVAWNAIRLEIEYKR